MSRRIQIRRGTAAELATVTLAQGELGYTTDTKKLRVGDGTTAGAIAVGLGTVTNTGGSLTANRLILGAGTDDIKTVAGIFTDGASKLTLGVAGSSVGGLLLANATSGTVELRPVNGALGTGVISVPSATDTMALLAATQTFTNKTLTSPVLTSPGLDYAVFTNASAPATPAAGKVILYAKADKLLYSKDDAGVETLVSGGAGGGGSGDMLLGTAQTITAAKTFNAGTLKIASGGDLIDTNGNELFKFVATGSAVNEFTITNGAAGTGATISATGGDTNIHWRARPKGSGQFYFLCDSAANPTMTLDSPSGAGTSQCTFVWSVQTVAYGRIGVTTTSNGIITGTASGDMAIRTEARHIFFSVDSGSTSCAQFVLTTGQFLLQKNITSSSTSTGTLVVSGGVGLAGNLFAGGTGQFTQSLTLNNLSSSNVGLVLNTSANDTLDYFDFKVSGAVKGRIVISNYVSGCPPLTGGARYDLILHSYANDMWFATNSDQAAMQIKTGTGQVRIHQSLVAINPTGGLGYGTGAGGTVTQTTSKSTGVTLNKVCGAITMHNASLAAATVVTFTLTNSAIAATDIIAVYIKSGATAGSYLVSVDSISAGSCTITLYNYSAGALGEAVVINFAVIKAVTT